MSEIIIQTLLAAGGTMGFCVLFHVPIRHIPVCGIIGGCAWGLYQLIILNNASSPVMATFMAAALVGLLSDLASRIIKEAATIFIIPGILPLVPGAYIFYAMQALVRNDMMDTSTYLTDTIKLAAAIALGLLAVGAVTKSLREITKKTADAVLESVETFKDNK
ncbi:MAG: threonine/serine exporter family protein [Eubacterium sp.]|nr:threonine/serine exporter family protein [Candidatus Colimonas fimequi]